jgi:hypothetical protein
MDECLQTMEKGQEAFSLSYEIMEWRKYALLDQDCRGTDAA